MAQPVQGDAADQGQGNRAMWGVDRRLIAKVTGRGCFGGEN